MDWRSVTGIIVGVISILFFIGNTIHLIIVFAQGKTKDGTPRTVGQTINILLLLAYSLAMMIFSGVLIYGIVKRRANLMKFWLNLSFFGFGYTFGYFVLTFIGAAFGGGTLSEIFAVLFTGLFILVVEAVLIWRVYSLYRDVSKENIEMGHHTPQSTEIEYKSQD